MRIRYFCHYSQLTGYGRAARDYLAALVRQTSGLRFNADDDLEIVAYEDLHQKGDGIRRVSCSPEPRYEHLDPLVTPASELVEADVEIHHAPPRLLAQIAKAETGPALELGPIAPARRRIALTTWETDTFPAEYAAAFRARTAPGLGFDRVIVPSEFCADVLADVFDDVEGVLATGGTSVVPHCYDPEFWSPAPKWRARDADPTAHGAAGLPLRFYTIGAGGERKNGLAVLKAYLAAFTADDQVSLMMVVGGADGNDVRSVMARSGIAAERLPPVNVINHAIDEVTLRELHGDGDCFVSATRGEGWGLGLFEAAIMGRWIISPIWGGHADFLCRDPHAGPILSAAELHAVTYPHLDPTAAGLASAKLAKAGDYPWLFSVHYTMTPCYGSEVRGEITKDANGRMVQSAKVSIPPGVTCKQLWAEPDLDEMIACMRELYEHRLGQMTDRESVLGDSSLVRTPDNLDLVAAGFAERFGYAAVGELLYNTLKEICAHE